MSGSAVAVNDSDLFILRQSYTGSFSVSWFDLMSQVATEAEAANPLKYVRPGVRHSRAW
jgi:hypothetical protein